jgi:hypothetical protein
MNAPHNIPPPATLKAINAILDDALDRMRKSDNEFGKLLAIRNAVAALYPFGDAAREAQDLISDSAIHTHNISVAAVQVALEKGVEMAQLHRSMAPIEPRPEPVIVIQNLPPEALAEAIEHVRDHLSQPDTSAERIRKLWIGVVAARDLATDPILMRAFLQLARQTGLHRDLGRHADEDLAHVIRWGLLDRDPFGDMGHD